MLRKSILRGNPLVKQTKIAIVGVGGRGCHALRKFGNVAKNCSLIAMDTEAKSLGKLPKKINKLLIGRDMLKGAGASNPKMAEHAAMADSKKIEEKLLGHDVVLLIVGLGGATGTGAGHIIGQVAKNNLNCLIFAFATWPFRMEKGNFAKAEEWDQDLVNSSTFTFRIYNDRLLYINPKATPKEAFDLADRVLRDAIMNFVGTFETLDFLHPEQRGVLGESEN